MKFKKGQSGNLNGRPLGSINKRTKLVELLEPHADALVNKAVELALSGDTNALRLCIERLIPKAKSDDLNVMVPNIASLQTTNSAMLAYEIIKNLAGSVITIEQAKLLFTLSSQLESSNKHADETRINNELRELRAQLDEKYKREY